MANYPNQKNITVAERVVRDKEHPFCMINQAALQKALASIRTIGGLKLWLYFNKNIDNYNIDLSRAELIKHWGVTKDTYDSGFKELRRLGFLTPVEDNENVLVFHEAAQEDFPTNSATLSENPTEIIMEQICAENPTKIETQEENPTKSASLSENPTTFNIGGFYF